MEIRLEFATEGHRFFDLRRWGIDNEVLNDYIQRDTKFRSFMRGAVYDPEKDDFWPLPKDQVNIQKGILIRILHILIISTSYNNCWFSAR